MTHWGGRFFPLRDVCLACSSQHAGPELVVEVFANALQTGFSTALARENYPVSTYDSHLPKAHRNNLHLKISKF